MKRMTLALVAVFLVGCSYGGADGGPTPPSPPEHRLTTTIQPGIYRDVLLKMDCHFVLDSETCEPACFPLEPLFPACTTQGDNYFYSRQSYWVTQEYGTRYELRDPKVCQGRDVATLWKLTFVEPNPATVIDCKLRSPQPQLAGDRLWYLFSESRIRPATAADLPRSVSPLR